MLSPVLLKARGLKPFDGFPTTPARTNSPHVKLSNGAAGGRQEKLQEWSGVFHPSRVKVEDEAGKVIDELYTVSSLDHLRRCRICHIFDLRLPAIPRVEFAPQATVRLQAQRGLASRPPIVRPPVTAGSACCHVCRRENHFRTRLRVGRIPKVSLSRGSHLSIPGGSAQCHQAISTASRVGSRVSLGVQRTAQTRLGPQSVSRLVVAIMMDATAANAWRACAHSSC